MIISLMLMKRWKGWKSIMANKPLDEKLLREMYNAIRSAEIKNIKTQKNDNKQMVKAITKYIVKKVEEEVQQDEN